MTLDDQLGKLLSAVVALLALCIMYLVILLPFSDQPATVGTAIGALSVCLAGIVGVRSIRR